MHKEINPAVFAIVTFPLLFGVMFGDLGHGFLWFVIGSVLCLLSSSLRKSPAMEGFLSLRYIFLMMGFFSMFTGLIYNEFFAIPMEFLSQSCYENQISIIGSNPVYGYAMKNESFKFPNAGRSDYSQYPNCVYPIGFDPVWALTDQLLSFTNNFKMKMAVIFAIIQMSIGIIMKGLNSLYFRNMLDFYFEFIPMFLFLFALFGWMDILIIGKWLEPKNIEGIYLPNTNTTNLAEIAKFNEVHQSPAIISTMIDIFLNMASNANKIVPNPAVPNQSGIDYNYVVGSQQQISIIFLLVALAAAPIMLCVKPLILKRRLDHHHDEEGAGHGVEVKSEKLIYQTVGGKSN